MNQTNPLQNVAEILSRFFIDTLKKLDQEAFAPLKQHEGKILQLETTDLLVSLYFTVTENNIKVSTSLKEDEAPNSTLSGKFLDTIKLAFANESNISIFKENNITVTGDTGFLMALNDTFKNIDIDWEERLSYVIGDFAAHNVGKFVKGAFNFAKSTADNRARDFSMFVQEEIKLVPTQKEIECFYQDISCLKIDADKLEKRIHRLFEAK